MNDKQINFAKLSPELKAEVDKIGESFGSKAELMKALVAGYKTKEIEKENVEIDIESFRFVDKKSKEDIGQLFTHLLSVLNINQIEVKTEKILISKKEKELIVKTEALIIKEKELIEEISNVEKKAKEDKEASEVIFSKIISDLKEEIKSKSLDLRKKDALLKKEQELNRELTADLSVCRKLIRISDEQDDELNQLRTELSKANKEVQQIKSKYSELDRELFETKTLKNSSLKEIRDKKEIISELQNVIAEKDKNLFDLKLKVAIFEAKK